MKLDGLILASFHKTTGFQSQRESVTGCGMQVFDCSELGCSGRITLCVQCQNGFPLCSENILIASEKRT